MCYENVTACSPKLTFASVMSRLQSGFFSAIVEIKKSNLDTILFICAFICVYIFFKCIILRLPRLIRLFDESLLALTNFPAEYRVSVFINIFNAIKFAKLVFLAELCCKFLIWILFPSRFWPIKSPRVQVISTKMFKRCIFLWILNFLMKYGHEDYYRHLYGT